jgi:hypothetical protein
MANNLLPSDIRREYVGLVDLVESFKSDLDNFLDSIPDQSYIQGLARSANSNSLVDQISYKN